MPVIGVPAPAAAARTGQGDRDTQPDAVLTARRVHAVAGGFGVDAALPAAVLARLAPLDGAAAAGDAVRVLDEAVQAAADAVEPRTGTNRPAAP